MKKQALLLSALLLLHGFVPVCYGITRAIGWEFLVNSELPFFLGMTILTTTVVVRLKGSQEPSVLAVILYPVSILNGLVCLWITKSLMGIPCVAVWVICCHTLFRELAPENFWRKLVSVVSGFLVAALVAMSGLTAFVGVMSRTTVVQEAESPEGTYTAQLIDADYGATGGDTLVKVWDNSRTVNLGLVRIAPEHQEVYRGNWGEFMDMTLSWQEDNILLINEKAYPIG